MIALAAQESRTASVVVQLSHVIAVPVSPPASAATSKLNEPNPTLKSGVSGWVLNGMSRLRRHVLLLILPFIPASSEAERRGFGQQRYKISIQISNLNWRELNLAPQKSGVLFAPPYGKGEMEGVKRLDFLLID